MTEREAQDLNRSGIYNADGARVGPELTLETLRARYYSTRGAEETNALCGDLLEALTRAAEGEAREAPLRGDDYGLGVFVTAYERTALDGRLDYRAAAAALRAYNIWREKVASHPVRPSEDGRNV